MTEFLDFLESDYFVSFVLQVFVAELMLFWGKKFRRYGAAALAGGFAAALVLAFAGGLEQTYSYGWIAIAFYAGLFLISFAAMFGTFRCSIWEAMAYSVTGYTLQHLSSNTANLIFVAAFGNADRGWGFHILTLALCAVVYTASYFLLLKRIKSARIESDALRVLMSSVVILALTIVVNMLTVDAATENPVILLYPIGLCVVNLVLQSSLARSGRLSEEKEQIAHLLRQQEIHSEISQESINAINVKCHDMKKQLETLTKISAGDGLEEYRRELEQSVSDYDILADTGNRTLDVVLTERALICRKKGIKFTYMADGSLLSSVSSVDLYSMIGNALDNCIEALARMEEGRRIMSMVVAQSGDIVLVRFENYFDGVLRMRDGRPQTRKNDELQHGYGLRSIQMTAEKYGGGISVRADGDVFSLNILLSGRAPKGEETAQGA